ncbi:unnamed protein product, partial [Polarella glacialis]
MAMDAATLGLHISTFLVWTLGVAILTWFICRRYFKTSRGAADDYFAGGRSLTWYVVAGSLMLTNLSTEQLVGLNSVIFADGCLCGTAWETFAALAMCVTAVVFLPRYMASGLCTTTGFLGERFDLTTRTLVSSIFLIFYAIGLCPIVLYTGALAFRNIFDLHDVPLWVVSLVIGIIGSCYALFGGLKAVAVSDCINGLGLVVVGLWVPAAALQRLGGVSVLFEDTSYLRPLVATSQVYDASTGTRSNGEPSVPWHVTLTGLMLTNLYYWSTNQLIVQRALAARSLAEGQKGVLFAAAMKVVGFTFLCIPGTLAIIMVNRGVTIDGEPFVIKKPDEVYPELVKAVMPSWSLGFFAAVLLGSVLSTFNSALNSAATLFGLEIYKIYVDPTASDEQVVKVSGIFGIALTVLAVVIAPLLANVASIFDFLQRARSIASLPIISIFIVGIATTRPDAFSAKVSFVTGLAAYIAGQWVTEIHFLHVFFGCFLLALASMMVATYVPCFRALFRQPRVSIAAAEPDNTQSKVDMTPWRWLYSVVLLIVLLIALLTVSLEIGSAWLFGVFWAAWAVGFVALLAAPSTPAQQAARKEGCEKSPHEDEGTNGEVVAV